MGTASRKQVLRSARGSDSFRCLLHLSISLSIAETEQQTILSYDACFISPSRHPLQQMSRKATLACRAKAWPCCLRTRGGSGC